MGRSGFGWGAPSVVPMTLSSVVLVKPYGDNPAGKVCQVSGLDAAWLVEKGLARWATSADTQKPPQKSVNRVTR